VSEVVATGPGAQPIRDSGRLGRPGCVRPRGSLYAESLVRLDEQLKARGKLAVMITPLPVVLEDDDVLEMVDEGLVPIAIVDDYLSQFCKEVSQDANSQVGAIGAMPDRERLCISVALAT